MPTPVYKPIHFGSNQNMAFQVQASFQLFGTFKRSDGWIIAHCPPLDITTQGRTLGEAKKNLVEASQLFIISCLERGTLDLALRELGFAPLKGKPASIPHNAFRFDAPIPLGFQRPAECHA
jgi:hypothetical protein